MGDFTSQFEELGISQLFAITDGSSDSESYITATETAHDSLEARALEQPPTSSSAFVTAHIEHSKRHWSQLTEVDSSLTDDEVAIDNRKVFEDLQAHPTWGPFFQTFGYDTATWVSSGELVVGEKFAEGAQAEIFQASVTWRDPGMNEYERREGTEWVLKVFKKGTLLRHLQSQWPRGYLQWWARDFERFQLGHSARIRWNCAVKYGKLPFTGDVVTVDGVIKGQRPQILECVDDWIRDLLCRCWQLDPAARPLLEDILSLIEANSNSPYIRRGKFERMKVSKGRALLGCHNPSHTLEFQECATSKDEVEYLCKLCLETGNGEVYHCTSCVDFSLHPKCARISSQLESFVHLYELDLSAPYAYPINRYCEGCLEDLEGSEWVYQCRTGGLQILSSCPMCKICKDDSPS